MKLKKIILVFGLLIIKASSIHAESSIDVTILECRNGMKYCYLNEFKVYKNEVLHETVDLQNQCDYRIKKLENALYRIEYQTKFGKTESVTILIEENNNYQVTLCFDFFDTTTETYIPIIDQLKNGQNYTIQIFSSGCFHSSKDSIAISFENEVYTIYYKEQVKILSPEDIEIIRRFEMEMMNIYGDGCTSTDMYFLSYNGFELLISDGSCKWNGASNLKKDLELTGH